MFTANLVITVMVYRPCKKVSQPIDHYCYGFHLQGRTGRKAVPATVIGSSPASVKQARENTLPVRGVKLLNTVPVQLRNSDHRDVDMFKNQLDIYLSTIP